MIVVERTYALTRIARGDYLLPSNDGRTIWRIARYTDGPSFGLDDMPRDREFWGIWRWPRPFTEGTYVATDDWDRWDFCGGWHDTRADAIRSALRLSAQPT